MAERMIVYEARSAPTNEDRRTVGIAVLAAIVLAWEAASRLGWVSSLFLILHAGDLMLTDKLMVGLVLLSVLGLASTWALRALEGYLAPWREEFR